MQSSYINSAVLHKIEGLNYPPLPMLHTLNALLEIKLRNCRVSIETKAIIKWLEMAFKLPSNVMTGTKHPINSVCSSKTSNVLQCESVGELKKLMVSLL